MNKFYYLHPLLKWIIALIMFVLGMAILGIWLDISDDFSLYYLLVFVVVPIGQFLFAPFFTLLGMYRYLSPMLLVFGASKKKYDLHNGTSFDYFMAMRPYKSGIEIRQKILEYYIEGLLEIVERVERQELPETVVVRGSSYFFSERTAQRLGFDIHPTGMFEKFNLLLNYLDLLWMYSLAQSKLTFPNLKEIKTAKTTGKRLLDNKAQLTKLYQFLKRKNNS